MKKIKIGIITYLIYILAIGPSFAVDTASLLPNAVQQFFDNNGNPLTSGKVYTYEAGTSTLKTTWKNSVESIANTNPIVLDAGGKAIIYGSGTYRQVVKDRNGNLIWDAVTAPGGGGSSPTDVGDGNLVGTVLPWSGLTAPNQYAFTYGQELNRTTYATLFTAITQQLNVICSAASNILTGISDTSSVRLGSPVELPLCVAAGTTVTAKSLSTITLSNPSSVSINSVATFFPWGNGDGSITFNVPDYRGVTLVGRTNMGGTASSNLTATYFGATGPNSLGSVGGSQSHTLTAAEAAILTYTSASSDSGHTHLVGNQFDSTGAQASGGSKAGAGTGAIASQVGFAIVSTTTTSNAGGGAHAIVQPSTTINYIIKITPDTSTSIATGVYSIGGMSGVIACGNGILCTGNTISVTGAAVGSGSTGNLAYYDSATSIAGNILANVSAGALTLGVSGSTIGQLKLAGNTSGTAIIAPQAVAGTPTLTLGTSSGTPAVTASSPLAINSTTGNISITSAALSKADDTNVTLALSGTPTTALLQATTITAGWTGRLAFSRLTQGATNTVLANATSGTADFAALSVGSCDTATKALQWTTNTGFACNSSITASTNANLTGVITSVGNATSIASQTGTGTKFVVDTSPILVTPNIGVATATSLKTASIFPPSDSTTALQVFKADGTTRVMDFDTTNARVGINKTPGAFDLDVNGAANIGTTLTFTTLSATSLGASTSTITGLTVNNSPNSSNDYYLYYSAADGAIRKCVIGSCNAAGAAGVTSLNGLTGGLTWSVATQKFIASGTYTPTTGMKYADISCYGGGGGGGGIAASTGNSAGASGGGAGSKSFVTASAATIGVSQVVTIGAAGAAGSAGNNAGGNGGDTSLGAICIGKGGTGGPGASAAASGGGGAGGVAGTGTITGTGMPGMPGLGLTGIVANGVGGSGGSSEYGGGGVGISTSAATAGSAGTGNASGGGGAASLNSASTAAGGVGTVGLIIITEYILN